MEKLKDDNTVCTFSKKRSGMAFTFDDTVEFGEKGFFTGKKVFFSFFLQVLEFFFVQLFVELFVDVAVLESSR